MSAFRSTAFALALFGSALALAPLALPRPASAGTTADGRALLQLGLYQKEGEARWAWESLQRKSPELAEGLTPKVVPLDAKRQGGGVALRATAPAGLDVQSLCRRMVGAGFGCLVLDAPAAPPSTSAAVPTPPPAAAPPPLQPATAPASSSTPPLQPAAAPPPAPPSMLTNAAPAAEGAFHYGPDDARTMAEIEKAGRRKGRLGAVIPDTKWDVAPATLKRENWNLCALTFDDGPHRVVTRQILEVLNREGIRATYFPVAKVAATQGDVIRDFLAAGHEIGNHSLTHSDLRVMSPEDQRHEIAEANRILRTFGANPVLFRPPYGRYTLDLLSIARDERMSPVLWTVDTRDWQVRDPDKIVQHVKTEAGTGSVLLLHSTYPSTVTALPRVIKEMRDKGCEFVTLSEWIDRMRLLANPSVVNASEPVVSASAPTATTRN
ncbi:polysaccharide deacetylase family protein [Azospirillum sp. sgz302134]